MRRIALYSIPLMLIVFAVNHLVPHWTASRAPTEKSRADGPIIPLIEESGGAHVTVKVDESKVAQKTRDFARFSVLKTWMFDPMRPGKPPENVAALSGRSLDATGFMAAPEMSPDGDVTAFFLVPSRRISGTDPVTAELPGLGLRIKVRCNTPMAFEPLRPVWVTGRFSAAPNPDEGYLYSIDADTVQPSGDPPLSLSADDAAALPEFDFFWLEILESQDARGQPFRFADELTALEGKRVYVEGHFMGREPGPPPSFAIAKHWWNGCCEGVAPTYFNSVLVIPAKGENMPPHWREKGGYAGILKISTDPDEWSEKAIVRFEQAMSSPSRAGMIPPLLPIWLEVTVLVLLVLVAALSGGHRPGASSPQPDQDQLQESSRS